MGATGGTGAAPLVGLVQGKPGATPSSKTNAAINYFALAVSLRDGFIFRVHPHSVNRGFYESTSLFLSLAAHVQSKALGTHQSLTAHCDVSTLFPPPSLPKQLTGNSAAA